MIKHSWISCVILFHLSCCTIYCQSNDLQEFNTVFLEREYSPEELDSLTHVIRQYFYEGSYEKVVELGPVMIKSAEKANLFRQEYRARSILGNTFIQLDDFESTFSLFDEGLVRAKKANDTIAMLSSYIDLGNTFLERDPERALPYLKSALTLCEGIDKNKRALFITHNNLSELYAGTELLKEAQFHLDKAELMLEEEGLKDWKEEYIAVILHTQGIINLKQKKYNQAITSIKNSLRLGIDEFDENYLVRNYQNLMSAYENVGQYKNVNTIRHLYDSLVMKRNEADKIKQQKIAASKFKLNRYKQELRASQLENELVLQQSERNSVLLKVALFSGTILLLLLGALLYSRNKRNKLVVDLKTKNHQYLQAKEISEKLARSNTKFLSTISHELRTPLYGIIGLSSVFLDDPELKNHAEDLKSLKFSADYLLALVNDVLNLNKFSSKEGEKINNVPFKLNQLLRHISQSFEFINKKNNNTFQILLDQEIPEIVLGDKTKLSQVLMNLVSNASKFTEDGQIALEAIFTKKTNNQTTILFNISDTGQGIPDEEQENIFKEFTQIESYTLEQGTGLGLPIVNKILNVLDSKLTLSSILGKGSTFSFELTLGNGQINDLQISPSEITGYDQLKNKKILIVDDNKINQVVTQKVLEQYGIAHNTASNGKEAIEAAKKNGFDAILMDINMPIMNGIDASKAIREFNENTPILALTATNYLDGINELSSSGINDSIVKPYKTEDLLDKLIAHVS